MRALALSLALLTALTAHAASTYPWLTPSEEKGTQRFEARFAPPKGFHRLAQPAGSMGGFLRALPLEPGRGEVHLYDGRLKANQKAQLAVIRLDVGKRDLQQCADAVMRLRAEYLWTTSQREQICFRLTNGDPAPWARYAKGERPSLKGKHVTWSSGAKPDASHEAFRRYLDFVFIYAGSSSLATYHLSPVDEVDVQPGDVLIEGGFPGHAVTVVDVVEDDAGHRRAALAQSYMPAQEVHVLDNPASPGSPWYVLEAHEPVVTPEWKFPALSLKRFRDVGCDP